jgi:hypothetical protein
MSMGVEALTAISGGGMLGPQAVEPLAELAPVALLACVAVGFVVSWSRSSPHAVTGAVLRWAHHASVCRQRERASRTGVQSATLPWPPS